ncbi:putative plant PDR ABC transporter associated [Dioscorea sansibarensis]
MNTIAPDGRRLGVAVLENFGIFTSQSFCWVGACTLIGFIIVFNVMFTRSLAYLESLGKPQAVVSDAAAKKMETQEEERKKAPWLKTVASGRACSNLSQCLLGRMEKL